MPLLHRAGREGTRAQSSDLWRLLLEQALIPAPRRATLLTHAIRTDFRLPLTCVGNRHFSTHLFNPQQLTEKWLSLQSMDSHPEQIALRPKEFFRTYDIEVLTEMQVRRVLCVLAGCLLQVLVCKGQVQEMWQLSLFLAHCMQLQKRWVSPSTPVLCPRAQVACGCSKPLNAIPPAAGRTPCASSVVTVISYLPFASILTWIWGDQWASD